MQSRVKLDLRNTYLHFAWGSKTEALLAHSFRLPPQHAIWQTHVTCDLFQTDRNVCVQASEEMRQKHRRSKTYRNAFAQMCVEIRQGFFYQLCTRIADCEDMSGVYTCSLSVQTVREKTEKSTRIFQEFAFFALVNLSFSKIWDLGLEWCVCVTLRVAGFFGLSFDKNR